MHLRNMGLVLGLAIVAMPAGSLATDLLSAYRQAQASSPLLKEAEARLRASEEGRGISRASLAPQLRATGSLGQKRQDLTGFGPTPIHEDVTASSYSVMLTQPLINGMSWAAMKAADARLREAAMALAATEQELILRTAISYFAVLQAEADERSITSHEKVLGTVLQRAQSALRNGTGNAIDVQDAQAGLDAIQARHTATRNAVRLARSDLKRLTHISPGRLADVRSIEGQGPQPASVDAWVAAARDHQPVLLQSHARTEAARQEASAAGRGRWPVLSLQLQHLYADSTFAPDLENEESLIGLQATWSIFDGGAIGAAKRQAEALADAAAYHEQNTQEEIHLLTERAFLTLQDSVAHLSATQRAVQSAALSMAATQRGYNEGVSSVVDVLESARRLTDAREAHARARYGQLLARLQLKAAAGILSEKDIQAINLLLDSPMPPTADGPNQPAEDSKEDDSQ